jgi:hypothetical protein
VMGKVLLPRVVSWAMVAIWLSSRMGLSSST